MMTTFEKLRENIIHNNELKYRPTCEARSLQRNL